MDQLVFYLSGSSIMSPRSDDKITYRSEYSYYRYNYYYLNYRKASVGSSINHAYTISPRSIFGQILRHLSSELWTYDPSQVVD